MAPDKFPAYPTLDTKYPLVFPDLCGKYVGSLHEDFIKSIVAVRCSSFNCDKLLIADGSSPTMTGYCGHLFCSGCAQELLVKYNEARGERRKGVKEDKGKYPPQEERREVYYDSNDSGHPLYECKKCPQIYVKAREGDKKFGYLKLFSANKMVENLYRALKKEEGYHCCDKICGEWHPKNNSLYCILCSEDGKPRHICLWHVDRHLKHGLKIMEPAIPNASLNPLFRAEQLPRDARLSSVDRTELRVIASFYHCAFCRQELKYDGEKHGRTSQLECGHFVGSTCVKHVLEKVDDPRQRCVHCFFCNDEVPLRIAAQGYFLFPCKQLADIVQKAPHALNDCNIGRCKMYHPHKEEGDVACRCCSVENDLINREKEVEREKNLAKPVTLASIGIIP